MRTILHRCNFYPFFAALLGIVLSLGNPSNLLFAQDEPPAPATPPAAAAAKPKPAAGKAAEKAADEPSGKAALPDDPAVAALLAANPTTPSECAKTAKILVDLHRPALAKEFLKKIADANLDRPQLAALGREIGSAAFLVFSQNEDLQPQGKQIGDAVLDAMNAVLQDPQKIAAAIAQLQDPSIEKRTLALQELQYAGNAGIAALIDVLADPKREAEFKYVRAALCTMGRQASTPMIGIMENANSKLKEQIIMVLGDMKADDAKMFLLEIFWEPYTHPGNDQALRAAAQRALLRTVGSLPTKEEAAKLLFEAAKNNFRS